MHVLVVLYFLQDIITVIAVFQRGEVQGVRKHGGARRGSQLRDALI